MKPFLLFLLALVSLSARAQYAQSIQGVVKDKETQAGLPGALVVVTDLPAAPQATSDTSGRFLLRDIPVGKHDLLVRFPGYQARVLSSVLITSGKEVLLDIELEEATRKIADVTIRARREINEMAIVSAKTFDVQETERYAGSRADPARMASNFAGVQGADDSRNDIIVRGNSPSGLLWRLEDLNIPNPNHFSIPGSTGGPVSILNNKTLGNSEFLTGAFPAEYGNSTAGVFDLRLRNGNAKRYELTGQIGFLGTELAAEGPISRKRGSSFLVTYRYSTLSLFQGLHIPIGTSSVPRYQDYCVKLNFPVGKKGTLSFFSLGGLSSIDLLVSTLSRPPEEIYGESDRDQYFTSNTGIAGASYAHRFGTRTLAKLSVGVSGNDVRVHHDKVFRDASYHLDSLKNILGFDMKTSAVNAHLWVNRKIDARNTLRLGIVNDLYLLNMTDSSRQYPPTRPDWQYRLGFRENTDLLQAYAQYKYRPSNTVTVTAGLHAQYLTHNGSRAVEPRAAVRWNVVPGSALTLGYGLHAQTQPLYQYFSHLPQNPANAYHNYDMGFTKSHHLVLGYDRSLGSNLNVHAETYVQYLYNIPVSIQPGSSYSNINQGASFGRVFPDTLKNTGTGYNYGLELTVSRTFSQGYYFLASGSLYSSKARGNDGVYRNTDYNGRFALNLLGGYEKKLGPNTTLITGVKITYAGGRLYSPPDVAASNATGDYVVIDSLRNTLRFPDYFRADVKLGLRANRRRLTHEIGLDLVNVFGIRNLLSLTYSSDLAAQGVYPFAKEYQLGFLPLFYYRIDFGFGKKD